MARKKRKASKVRKKRKKRHVRGKDTEACKLRKVLEQVKRVDTEAM